MGLPPLPERPSQVHRVILVCENAGQHHGEELVSLHSRHNRALSDAEEPMGTRARVTTVAGAATLLCAASIFGAGSSMASPTPAPAAAAAQSLVGGCGDTVRGTPGQPVGVRVAGLSVINLGHVPQSGSTTFDATSIVSDLLGPVAPQVNDR